MLTDQHPAYGEVCPHGHLFIAQDDPAVLQIGHGVVALRFAGALGLEVFPIVEHTKKPASPNGFKDATRDPAVITSWYRGHRTRGVGIPTGTVNDLLVVDMDRHGGADGIANFRNWLNENGLALPMVPYAITPNNGMHLYLRLNGRAVASRTGVLPGVDIQSDGKYVLGWPSRVRLPRLPQRPGEPRDDRPRFGTYDMHGCLCMRPEVPGEFLDALEQLQGTAAGNGEGGGLNRNLPPLPPIEDLMQRGVDHPHDDNMARLAARLCAQGLAPGDAYQVWRAVADRTQDPARPFTRADFDRNWSGPERKGFGQAPVGVADWVVGTTAAQVAAPQVPAIQTAPRQLVLTPASQIAAVPVVWAWMDGQYGRIPSGSLGLFAGREGTGKSSFVFWMAARVTTGTLPGMLWGQRRAVFICASEDSWKHTIRPRLEAAGADLNLVFRVEVQVVESGGTTSLSLPVDSRMLEHAIIEKKAALVVLDPLMSSVSDKLDTHVNKQVRQAIEPLAAIADRTDVIFAGIAHFNKSTGTDPSSLIGASGAFKDVPRFIFAFATDSDGSQVITEVKNNLGRMDLPSIAYHIETAVVPTQYGPAEVGRIVLDGTAERTVQDILGDQVGTEREGLGRAEDYLRETLAMGPRRSKDVEEEARESQGVSTRTLKRARSKLAIPARKGGSGQWWISLPEHEGDLIKAAETDLPAKSAKSANAGPLGMDAKGAGTASSDTAGPLGTLPSSAPHDGNDYGPGPSFGDLYGGHAT